jgi:TrmH family RNA methyltransferase
MAETITSAQNPLLKDVRRAVAHGGLTSQGWCVAESFHLLNEALRSGRQVNAVIVAESASDEVDARVGRHNLKRAILPDKEFHKLASTENSQGVIALVTPATWTRDDLYRGVPLVVALDRIQDPGNAGAIVRTAEAFGATGVIFLKGSVNPYNPKTLRASAGSLFRIPFLAGAGTDDLRGVTLYAAMPSGTSLDKADLAAPCGLVIGSEAHGVSPELRSMATEISIPTSGVESLNAAVAAGILLYEARRQRTRTA